MGVEGALVAGHTEGRIHRKGAIRKAEIVEAAAELIHVQGVSATSVDAVLRASGTGKSQFYYYFENKEALVHEVLKFQLARYIAAQEPFIEELDTWKGIKEWMVALADQHERRELVGGCPIGSLAAEMSDRDEALRKEIARAFAHWESYLVIGLQSLKARGLLVRRADAGHLAESVMAAIQGGYLLATTTKDIRPMRSALRAAYSYLRSYRTSGVAESHRS